MSRTKPRAPLDDATCNPASSGLLHHRAVLWHTEQPRKQQITSVSPPPAQQQKKPLLEPSVLKEVNNWGGQQDDSCNYIPGYRLARNKSPFWQQELMKFSEVGVQRRRYRELMAGSADQASLCM